MSSPDPNELAVVVGGNGALGSAIVDALVAAGLRVISVARSAGAPAESRARADSRIVPLVADLSNDEAIEQIRAAVDAPVAMVVHAPGVPVAGGILDAPPTLLAEACNIKVGGFVRLVRGVDHRLRAKSRLVAIGGHYGFEPTAYAATAGVANAALANLVRQISWAYGPRQITTHLVAPGPADTERLHNVAAARAAREGKGVDAVLADMRSESAIGAFVEPAQIGWAIRMLLDPEADALAGSTLFLDAGRRRAIP
jgi:NAD(P)-dependent dehydrogenase (short-subunit alcohol dehydrogenase family)